MTRLKIVIATLTFVLCTTLVAAPRNSRVTMEGRITQIAQQGNGYRVTLDNGGYSYYLPQGTVQNRALRVGDTVRLNGYAGRNNDVAVDGVTVLGNGGYRNGNNGTYGNNGAYGNNGRGNGGVRNARRVTGVVESVNRRLNYITVRDDNTGRLVKIDVRSMDTRRSANVWRLRNGDRIDVSGAWANGDTFQADRVR